MDARKRSAHFSGQERIPNRESPDPRVEQRFHLSHGLFHLTGNEHRGVENVIQVVLDVVHEVGWAKRNIGKHISPHRSGATTGR